ncbi:UNVERIFIED_CONTAM: hypothetical protein GTU68_064739 [Idotea baltica]|nr:hypothetical protein [Idotea baltica]
MESFIQYTDWCYHHVVNISILYLNTQLVRVL